MNSYYTYDFISPEPLYAKIREELRSYFESGSVDDTLFPLWSNWTLRKLTKGTLPIRTAFINISDNKGLLPEDFKYVREVWSLEQYEKQITDPSSTYVRATATRLDTRDVRCNPCTECTDPPLVEAIYKVTSKVFATFSKTTLLRPGKILDTPYPCLNYQSQAQDIYDIEGRDLKVNFLEGTLYLSYYAEMYDEWGFQLLPDDVRILEAVEYFIRFKIAEMLYNQATDESFNQSRIKKQEAEQAYLEKFIIAQTWMKNPTKAQKEAQMKWQKKRLSPFKFND